MILFGISSGQKSSKESCWLKKKRHEIVPKKLLQDTLICVYSYGLKIADYSHQKRGLSTNCFCSNIFRHASQLSCSLVVFRHILQLHHVHGGLKRRHNHHDSELSPPIGGHSRDAKLGEFSMNIEEGILNLQIEYVLCVLYIIRNVSIGKLANSYSCSCSGIVGFAIQKYDVNIYILTI